MVMASPFRKLCKTRINLFLDIALALTFVVQMEEHFMGLRNHEVIGLFFGAALLIHLVLHWQWIAAHAKKYLFNFRLPLRKASAVPASANSAAASSEV